MSDQRPNCLTCRHPEVQAIDAAILEDAQSYIAIARWTGIGEGAISEHARLCLEHHRGGTAHSTAPVPVAERRMVPPCQGFGRPGQRYCGACPHLPPCDRLGHCRGCPDKRSCVCWHPEEMRLSEHRRMLTYKAQAHKCGLPAPTVLRQLSNVSEAVVWEREEVLA